MICRQCRSSPSDSLIGVSSRVSRSSFQQFFDHEPVRGSHLSFFQRSVVVTLWQLTLSVDIIQQLTGCDPRTTSRWTDQFTQHHSLEDMHGRGRHRITDSHTDQAIVDLATSNPFTTPRQINSELQTEVSNRTIRRRLNEAGLLGRVARVEHPFTDEHIAKRLAFAHEHETWSDDQWDRVIFGDECYIYLGTHGQTWVQRPVDCAYLKQFMLTADYQSPPKVGIFCCFTSQGVGSMRVIYDDMDQRLYTDTMKQTLKPSALRMFPSGAWQYLHDNAGYHIGHVSSAWFHNNGIDLIKLPPYSPDLNPIENLFNYWKRKVEAHRPGNVQQLTEFSIQEWSNIPPIICSTLVDSMRDRMKAVVAAEGHKSGY